MKNSLKYNIKNASDKSEAFFMYYILPAVILSGVEGSFDSLNQRSQVLKLDFF
jgi:hypothetical protein